MVTLKYLSNSWRTLEMPLVNCEVNLILTWSTNCVIVYTNVAIQGATYTMKQSFMVQQLLYQLKIMQNYYRN